MACSEDVVGERRCAVTIVEDEIPQAGWQTLDLRRTLDGLSPRPAPAGAAPAARIGLKVAASAAFAGLLSGRKK